MNKDFWKFWKLKNISNLFSRMIILVTLTTTFLIGGILINHEIVNYRRLEELQRNKYITEQKTFIKDIVQNETRYILLRKKSWEQEYINELKFNVEQAYELAEGIFYKTDNYSLSEKKLFLKKIISLLKSKSHFSKIFIGSLDGKGIYYPGHPEYENSNITQHTDVHGNKVIKSELDFLQKNKEGFIFYGQDNTPKTDTVPVRKVVYLKKFEPLNCYFGGKIYMEDHYDALKKDVAEKISSVRFKHSGYAFINHINGTPIVLDGKAYNGSFNFFDGSDTSRYNVFLKELEVIKSDEKGGYFSYYWNKLGATKLSPKLSYVNLIPELNWIVGAGFYLNDIDQELLTQKQVLQKGLRRSIAKIILVLSLVLLLEELIIIYFDKHYNADSKKFFSFMKHVSEEYEKINPSSFYYEEFKETANAVNNMIDTYEEIHRKLIEEQERATHSDKLKTAFLANMSHEIRTPMNVIIGFSEILSETENEYGNREEMVNHIKSSSHQLLKLIDDIVDISKIESNQLKITKRTFTLPGFLKIIEADVRYMLDSKEKKNIEFITKYHFPFDFALNTDEFRLRQVLLNLLSNSIKFTPDKGTITLLISLEKEGMMFSVKDTGIGIPKNEHELIFERFRQSETLKWENYGGTGLGLAISKNIIELLGGKIKLKSKIGEGSEFYFTIPV